MALKSSRLARFSLLACLLAPSAHASVINGNFDAGLTGWTTQVSGVGSEPGDRVTIANNGGNNYLHLSTQPRSPEPNFIQIRQAITVQAGQTQFLADIKDFAATADATAGDNNIDFLSMSIQRTAFDVWGIVIVDDLAGRGITLIDDPLLGVGVALRAPSDAFFDVQVVADLSMFIGETVDISLYFEPHNDGFTHSYGIDNISIGAPAITQAVPVPSSLFLLLGLLLPLAKFINQGKRA